MQGFLEEPPSGEGVVFLLREAAEGINLVAWGKLKEELRATGRSVSSPRYDADIMPRP